MNSSATETLVEVAMPKMGISVSEGTILEWRKQPGDWVEADETIADVTTDKVDVEIPSPASGRLARIVVEAGETVDVGATIAEIDCGGEGRARRIRRSREHDGRPGRPPEDEPDRSGFFSPVVRRIADKHDIDLEPGRGNRHRRTRAQEGRTRPRRGRRQRQREAGAGRCTPSRLTGPNRTRLRTTSRAATSRRRRAPRADDPHAPCDREAHGRQPPDGGPLHDDRRGRHVEGRGAAGQLKPVFAQRGVALTYLAFVAAATTEALEHHPVLNASVEGEELVYHDDINLGIAVALDEGLIVPVIAKAQRLSLEGLAASIADVAERARSKRLDPDEVHGGTFTITNPGQFGAVLATPIINQPQVGDPRPRGDREAAGGRDRRGRRRFDCDPADDLSADVLGPPGARRRRGGEVPRADQSPARGMGGGVMATAVTTHGNGRPAPTATRQSGAIGPVPFQHEELAVRTRRALRPLRAWSRSTRPRSARRSAACGCGTTRSPSTGSGTRCGSPRG